MVERIFMVDKQGRSITDVNRLSSLLASEITNQGYSIADCLGVRVSRPDQSSIGILRERGFIQKSFLGLKWLARERAENIGTLWYNNDARNAVPSKKWVLEVNGNENVSKLTALVRKISDAYSINLEVDLLSQTPKSEKYSADFNYGYDF